MLEHGDPAVVPQNSDPRLVLALGNQRGDSELQCLVAPLHGEVNRLPRRVRVEEDGKRGQAEQRFAIHCSDQVARTDPRGGRRTVRENFRHHRGGRRKNADLAQRPPPPALALRSDRLDFDRLHRAVALEFDRNERFLAPHHIPGHALAHVAHAGKFADRVTVDLEDFVARLQPGFGRGSVG